MNRHEYLNALRDCMESVMQISTQAIATPEKNFKIRKLNIEMLKRMIDAGTYDNNQDAYNSALRTIRDLEGR